MGSSIQATDLGSGFERWRQTCGTILKSSNCPMKRGGPSRLRAYPILSVAEQLMQKKEQEQEHHHHHHQQKQQQKHLGRSQDDYNELQDILQNYKEDEEGRKMRGMVNQWKDELIRTSPIVRFMSKHLSIVGCSPYNETISATSKLPPILVTSCPEGQAGGFSPSFPGRPHSESGIVVCANRIMDKTHLEHTMAHEMIHWWDHCRFKVDWNNLRHHACTEIRAAVLSGDCRWSREILRRNFAFRKQFQACARRRAVLSVEGNPNCPDRPTAERAVDEVWQSCFNDHRPFDEVY